MGAIIRSLVMVVTLSIFTGLVYPLAMTGLAQVVFPSRANGSIIIKDGVPVGSALIGQAFTDARYFSSRPSAGGNDAANSGGTNYGGTSAKLQQQVGELAESVRAANGWTSDQEVPSVLVTIARSNVLPKYVVWKSGRYAIWFQNILKMLIWELSERTESMF